MGMAISQGRMKKLYSICHMGFSTIKVFYKNKEHKNKGTVFDFFSPDLKIIASDLNRKGPELITNQRTFQLNSINEIFQIW